MTLEDNKPQLEHSPSAHEYGPAQQTSKFHGLPAVEPRTRRETSEDDDVPLRNRLALRESRKLPSGSIAVAQDRPRIRQSIVDSPKKLHKKPGPKPWAAKPMMKNDMNAKMEVIREIERLWGKNFIKAYIPKCHRPLVKKRRNGKRTVYRDHETDAKKWLPSVLKAVLMIARVTDDKVWLKKAMAEVVRYRIKHTGNRKPQLVTTDFDVIEDMLVRSWSCEESFQIRYKHLLMAQPKEERPADEDIDHILGCGDSGSDKDSDEDGHLPRESDDDEEMAGMDEDEEDFGEFVSGQDMSIGYAKKSDYVNNAPHLPPKKTLPPQPPKQAKSSIKQHNTTKPPPQHHMYGFGGYGPFPGYGPPMNGYGHPMPAYPPHMKSFPPHMYGYGPYAGYGQQGHGKDPRGAQQGFLGIPPFWPHSPATHSLSAAGGDFRKPGNDGDGSLGQRNERFSPFSATKRAIRGPTYDEGADHSMYGMSMGYEAPREQRTPQLENSNPRIKREPGVEDRPITIDDFDGPSNYLGGAPSEEPGEEPDVDMEEAVRLELEEAEAQHKLVQLKKKLAIAQAKKNR